MADVHRNLAVLMIEDSERDALLILDQIESSGYHAISERIETAEELTETLVRTRWDVVLSDYSLPAFDTAEALALIQRSGNDLPFIIVSGYITDETAVAAMKAGAHDYLMKDKLARLGPAVERELRDAEVRRERRHCTHGGGGRERPLQQRLGEHGAVPLSETRDAGVERLLHLAAVGERVEGPRWRGPAGRPRRPRGHR